MSTKGWPQGIVTPSLGGAFRSARAQVPGRNVDPWGPGQATSSLGVRSNEREKERNCNILYAHSKLNLNRPATHMSFTRRQEIRGIE